MAKEINLEDECRNSAMKLSRVSSVFHIVLFPAFHFILAFFSNLLYLLFQWLSPSVHFYFYLIFWFHVFLEATSFSFMWSQISDGTLQRQAYFPAVAGILLLGPTSKEYIHNKIKVKGLKEFVKNRSRGNPNRRGLCLRGTLWCNLNKQKWVQTMPTNLNFQGVLSCHPPTLSPHSPH